MNHRGIILTTVSTLLMLLSFISKQGGVVDAASQFKEAAHYDVYFTWDTWQDWDYNIPEEVFDDAGNRALKMELNVIFRWAKTTLRLDCQYWEDDNPDAVKTASVSGSEMGLLRTTTLDTNEFDCMQGGPTSCLLHFKFKFTGSDGSPTLGQHVELGLFSILAATGSRLYSYTTAPYPPVYPDLWAWPVLLEVNKYFYLRLNTSDLKLTENKEMYVKNNIVVVSSTWSIYAGGVSKTSPSSTDQVWVLGGYTEGSKTVYYDSSTHWNYLSFYATALDTGSSSLSALTSKWLGASVCFGSCPAYNPAIHLSWPMLPLLLLFFLLL